jgi:hypothetical protein
MEAADVEQLLRMRLAAEPGVIVGYLFGSVARGDARRDSDVDVAVLYPAAPRRYEELPLTLEADLSQALGRRVDIVVLNHASADLVHRVLRDGKLLLERDRSARIAFEVRARNEYFDMQPIWRRYRRLEGPQS